MFCPNCGTKVMEEQEFCPECGTHILNHNVEDSEGMTENTTGELINGTGVLKIGISGHDINHDEKKQIKKISGVIGGIIVLICMVKMSIIGFRVSEAPLLFGSLIAGGILSYISTKIKINDDSDD
jgi:uncharacterized membrane protein YvbJ